MNGMNTTLLYEELIPLTGGIDTAYVLSKLINLSLNNNRYTAGDLNGVYTAEEIETLTGKKSKWIHNAIRLINSFETVENSTVDIIINNNIIKLEEMGFLKVREDSMGRTSVYVEAGVVVEAVNTQRGFNSPLGSPLVSSPSVLPYLLSPLISPLNPPNIPFKTISLYPPKNPDIEINNRNSVKLASVLKPGIKKPLAEKSSASLKNPHTPPTPSAPVFARKHKLFSSTANEELAPGNDRIEMIITRWNNLASKVGYPKVLSNNQTVRSKVKSRLYAFPETTVWDNLFKKLEGIAPWMKTKSWFSFSFVMRNNEKIESFLNDKYDFLKDKDKPANSYHEETVNEEVAKALKNMETI